LAIFIINLPICLRRMRINLFRASNKSALS
jgi:hypothetical protein